MENNKRLKEIKLAMYINYIDKTKDRNLYSKLIRILTCVASTLGENYLETFTNLIKQSINDGLLGASDKEIALTCKKYFTKQRTAKLLGIAHSTFYYKYGAFIDRDFKVDNLEPIFNKEDDYVLVDFLTNFIDKFNYKLGNDEHDLKSKTRTYEIEFWLIYDKLINIFRNVGMCDKFIFNLCNATDIDYSTIAQLKNNIHIITRMYPNFRYNNRYFMQEVVTLYTKKGVAKGTIGSSVLGKDSSYLYNGSNKKYREIPDDELDWQYTHTIDWTNMNVDSVLKFIDLFHSFIRYDF